VVFVLAPTTDEGGDGYQQSPQHTSVYIAGTSVNQDGRSSSLTTPNGASQQSLLRAAASQAQVGSLQSIMLHGTATPLGDPIEVAAITAVFDDEQRRRHHVAAPMHLSAPKSTVGHAEGAAGVHSLLAAMFALQHRRSASVAHLRQISEHVVSATGGAQFLIPVQSSSMMLAMGEPPSSTSVLSRDGGDMNSGCSAFGMSGVNAHAVVRATISSGGGGGSSSRIDDVLCSHGGRSSTVMWPCPALDAILAPVHHRQLGVSMYVFSMSDSVYAADFMDHRVRGRALLAAAAGLSMMAAAARTLLGSREDDSTSLRNIAFTRPTFIECMDRAAVGTGSSTAGPGTTSSRSEAGRAPAVTVCCTVGMDGIAAITDDVFASHASVHSKSGGGAMQCRIEHTFAPVHRTGRSPALGSAQQNVGFTTSASLVVRQLLMDSCWSSSSNMSSQNVGGDGSSGGDLCAVAARITSGNSSADATGRHPSDVHVCPRMVDSAMHSGAASATGDGGTGGGHESRALAIPCEMHHFFVRGGAMPRDVVSAVRRRNGSDAAAVTDHVIIDPLGREAPSVVMRGLMTKVGFCKWNPFPMRSSNFVTTKNL